MNVIIIIIGIVILIGLGVGGYFVYKADKKKKCNDCLGACVAVCNTGTEADRIKCLTTLPACENACAKKYGSECIWSNYHST